MSNIESNGIRLGWIIAPLVLLPFFISAASVWLTPEGQGHVAAAWILAGFAITLIVGMGCLRLSGSAREARANTLRLALAALPSLFAAAACAMAPVVGFRWTFALLMGAMTGEGLSDFGGEVLPQKLERVRPAIGIGALLALLVGFMGSE